MEAGLYRRRPTGSARSASSSYCRRISAAPSLFRMRSTSERLIRRCWKRRSMPCSRGFIWSRATEVILRLAVCTPNPVRQGLTRVLRDFKLHRPLCLLLHYDRLGRNLVTMGDVPHPQPYEVTMSGVYCPPRG